MTTFLTPIGQQNNFICVSCCFSANKKSDWTRHLITAKHKNTTTYNKTSSDDNEINKNYVCECGKVYNHRASLYNHKKKCIKEETIINDPVADHLNSNNFKILTNLVLEVVKSNSELLKQNQEFQKENQELHKQVIEVCKNNNTNINSHNNSHNKTFNMQFFLNEQCKDAMNIMDFVNTFHLEFSDLERIGEIGYVEGISNIVIDKLNEMDIHKRPIHCSDAKREIMYVKDKDVWEKENANNDKIRLALKHITKKNSDMIRPWANAHPGVLNSDHRLSDKYQEIIIEAMGGNSGTIKECETKIIKKISKMVLIDKGH
jgi:hypothetical protein